MHGQCHESIPSLLMQEAVGGERARSHSLWAGHPEKQKAICLFSYSSQNHTCKFSLSEVAGSVSKWPTQEMVPGRKPQRFVALAPHGGRLELSRARGHTSGTSCLGRRRVRSLGFIPPHPWPRTGPWDVSSLDSWPVPHLWDLLGVIGSNGEE